MKLPERLLFHTSRSCQSGFTLFELLVVLAVVATVAGIGVQVLTGVTDDAEQALARAEMDNIASAIQRFHRDTGYWPKQGPFDVATDAHPANLSQLRGNRMTAPTTFWSGIRPAAPAGTGPICASWMRRR